MAPRPYDYTPPTRLSDESIEEFRKLWQEEFGETISHADASIRALEIIVLYEKLYSSEAGLKKPEGEEQAPPQTSA